MTDVVRAESSEDLSFLRFKNKRVMVCQVPKGVLLSIDRRSERTVRSEIVRWPDYVATNANGDLISIPHYIFE